MTSILSFPLGSYSFLQLKNSQDILLRKGHLFHSHLSFISVLRHNFISFALLYHFSLSNHVIIVVIIMELKVIMLYILLDTCLLLPYTFSGTTFLENTTEGFAT